MYIKLPRVGFDSKNLVLINQHMVPYELRYYGNWDAKELRTLREVQVEVEDLLRRFVVLFPDVVETREDGFYCLVHDEQSGISRSVLEIMGYQLQESDFTPYGLYWVKLRTELD